MATHHSRCPCSGNNVDVDLLQFLILIPEISAILRAVPRDPSLQRKDGTGLKIGHVHFLPHYF